MKGRILQEAHALINADRQDAYGPPAESFARTDVLWSAYLGRDISAKDVALCLALLKFSREA
ncbi:MAG: DUF6378 domain-containing protein [Desulfovibrio sp.]|jgi:hypothetical protein|nr:DUF6378 domain-containing protein [Desulfovibrio sp.]